MFKMSLEWSTLNECFTSPLQNIPTVNKTSNWTEFDSKPSYNNEISTPYLIDNSNVVLAEDAFKQVINQEAQYISDENPNHHIAVSTPNINRHLGFPETEMITPVNHLSNNKISSNDIRQELNTLGNSNYNRHRQINILPKNQINVNSSRVVTKPPIRRVGNNLQLVQQPVTTRLNIPPILKTNNYTKQFNLTITDKEQENNWLTILIIFITVFLLLACK